MGKNHNVLVDENRQLPDAFLSATLCKGEDRVMYIQNFRTNSHDSARSAAGSSTP